MKEKSKGNQYKCSQIFGFKGVNEKVHEEDIVSVLKFDQTGQHVCLGDKAGRIIIFKVNDSKRKEEKYDYYTQFQAYSREFDPLNSIQVDEEVSDITWMKPQGNYLKLLTMNCKNIKLWKIYEKPEKKVIKSAGKQLTIPKLHTVQSSINATLQQNDKIFRKTFPNKHQEDLISVCHSQNQQYLLSSDSLQTLLWSFEKPTIPYLIADLKKGKKVQEVKQNINCVKIHPHSDNMFAYGTNRGSLFLSDMRISSSNKPTTFKIETQEKKNFFTQMISSYSSVDFLANSKYLVCRDFLTIKIWDVCKTNKPIACVPVQDSLKTKLCEIFENDSIFDKFQVSASKDSNTILTGNYNNSFHLIDVNELHNTQYEINYKKQTVTKPMIPGKNVQISKMDYFRKTTACDFHPKKNTLAVASLNCFFTYTM